MRYCLPGRNKGVSLCNIVCVMNVWIPFSLLESRLSYSSTNELVPWAPSVRCESQRVCFFDISVFSRAEQHDCIPKNLSTSSYILLVSSLHHSLRFLNIIYSYFFLVPGPSFLLVFSPHSSRHQHSHPLLFHLTSHAGIATPTQCRRRYSPFSIQSWLHLDQFSRLPVNRHKRGLFSLPS